MSTFLGDLQIQKVPLRYGTDSCCLVLSDSRYTEDVVRLRNDPAVGQFLNQVDVTTEEHEQWMASRLRSQDMLDFVILVDGTFAGNVSFFNIEPGRCCEYGRLIMPNDGRRIYALAVEFLAMSFGFEVLGMDYLYCAVIRENESVWRFHLANGWDLDPTYDRDHMVNKKPMHLLGMRIDRTKWPVAFEHMKKMAKRLLSSS